MRKCKLKKGLAWILACALFMGMTPVNTQAKEQKNSEIVLLTANVTSGGSAIGGAATIEPTAEPKEIVTVTPFSGLWKYYGQKRTFIRDVHYAVSDEKDLPDGVTLTISSETAGKQQFVLKDERSSDEKQKISYQLAKNAPAYEIRAYHTNAVAKTEKDTINIADRTGLTDDKVEIEAPAGYRISSQASVDANWADTMSVTLTEGKNEIAYYLASKQADATKNAIDTTKKTITIVADFTAPQITSVSGFDSDTDTTSSGLITGNEPGKFYYVVLPKALGEEAEKESGGMTTKFILSRVTSHYGIVGYGRVDGVKASDFSFNGLAAETEYVIYSFMTDDAGNESAVAKSAVFTTDKMAIAGSVEITGTPAIDEMLTAKPSLDSVDPGELSYQWYRVKKAEDAESFESVLDETGGAEEDDLEADDDEDDDEEDDSDDDGTYELDAIRKFAANVKEEDDVTTIDGAAAIKGAAGLTYKVTKEDIGYRLICQVKAKKYSGYRAKYVPENTAMYRTVIIRVKVPVKKKALTKKMIRLKKKYAYEGKAIKGNETVKDGNEVLDSGKDYKASYQNNKNLGKATITIKGIGNYKGTKKVSYTIVKRSVRSVTCHYKKTRSYTGRWVKPNVTLKVGKVKLKKNRDYTLVYRNNLQIGKASVVIRGMGNFTGKKTITFKIVPQTPKIQKLKKNKKSFVVTYSSGKMVHGYRMEVSTASSFAAKKTQKYILNGNRFEACGLKKGTYYIRVKAYYSKKGKRYESGYTSKRKIKIKK
ncbi:putative uncharacterized protein [Clostridium sp. CAG:62]|nr:putative uncharacterized protein [Clostridium sp. CAG:62]